MKTERMKEERARKSSILDLKLKQESSLEREIRIGRDPDEVTELALALFAEKAKLSIAERGRFTVLLSGGRAPIPMYQKFKTLNLEWDRIHLFWGDERVVPHSSSESNFGNFKKASEGLMIPSENVHPVQTALLDPERIAREYENDIRFEFGHNPWPTFDFALQGLGPDGHTASLFPGSQYEHDSPRWVIAPYVEKLGAFRITVSLGVLNACRTVLFLVTGAEKAEIIHQVLKDPIEHRALLPSQRVQPRNGELFWFLDQAAASRL